MSALDIAAIRQRFEAATPGPWEVVPEFMDSKYGHVAGRKPKVRDARKGVIVEAIRQAPLNHRGRCGEAEANAEFIAHAPGDIAALLGEVETLRAECKRLAVGHDEYNRANQVLAEENERLRGELERTRQGSAGGRMSGWAGFWIGLGLLAVGYGLETLGRSIAQRTEEKIRGDFGPLFAPPSQPCDTSEDAAIAIQPHLNKLRARVLEFIAQRRSFGATADECEVGIPMKGSTLRPRLVELELVKRIVKSERTRPTRSGRQASIYVAV